METPKTRLPSGSYSPLRDMENIKQNGAASLEELKEFLSKLQGRSPQEVVGIVSTSLLVQSMIISTLGTIAILAIFTIGPYMIYGAPQEKKTAAAPPAASAAPATSAAQPTGAADQAGELTDNDKSQALQKMGIDETKTAKPDENPLDKKFDNLLDNVK